MMSYFTGWQATLAWQSATASGSFLSGTIIQGLVSLDYPDTYSPTRWQGTLLVFGTVLILLVANIWGWRALPTLQHLFLLFHISLFLALVICFWTLSPSLNRPRAVFTTFYNGGGWPTVGLSLMIGQPSSALYPRTRPRISAKRSRAQDSVCRGRFSGRIASTGCWDSSS